MTQEAKYTLILTVYAGTTVKEFNRSLGSMLSQTIPPSEIIIVEDGSISDALKKQIERSNSNRTINVIKLKENSGPAVAAEKGIEAAKYELIARLDTDDYAKPGRIEEEIAFLSKNPEYASVGTLVREVSDDGEINAAVELPESYEEIKKFARRRCPCRQTTLLYKKSAILAVGGYSNMRVAEEWDLYNRLLDAGYKVYNLQTELVDMHVANDYYARRGGGKVLRELIAFKIKMLLNHQMNAVDFVISASASFISCVVPNKVRKLIYIHLLRK